MSHVDDGKLNALLDGEMDGAEAAAVEAHIAGCPECARRLEEAKRFLAAAGDLLGALEMPEPVAAPQAPRRVTKTVREAALDVDGTTQQSPAIGAEPSGPLFHRAPRPQPERRPFDYTSLAWAATIVLAIGVGYLANEVRHASGGPVTGATPGGPPQATPGHPVAGVAAADKATPTARPRQGEPGAARGPLLAAAGRPNGPPAAKAPPGEGKPVVAGRSATGLGHKRLEPPARHLAAAAAPPARAVQLADAATSAPASAVAAPSPLRNAPEARRLQQPSAAGAAGAPTETGEAAAGSAVASRLVAAHTGFRAASLEEAVSRLGGTIRLIDGMHGVRVEIGPGRQVSGADSGSDVVRVVYGQSGHELVLDQQRASAPDRAPAALRRDSLPADAAMGYGDTLLTVAPDGDRRLRWLDANGFWLSLSGRVPADSLRRLTGRVR